MFGFVYHFLLNLYTCRLAHHQQVLSKASEPMDYDGILWNFASKGQLAEFGAMPCQLIRAIIEKGEAEFAAYWREPTCLSNKGRFDWKYSAQHEYAFSAVKLFPSDRNTCKLLRVGYRTWENITNPLLKGVSHEL
jgi:hypothetical protein